MQLKISQRLTGAFALLTLMVVLVAAQGLWQMSLIRSGTTEIVRNWLPSVEAVNQMNTATSDFRVAEYSHVLNTQDAAMAEVEKELAQSLKTFNEADKRYSLLISSPEERRLYDLFKLDWNKYLGFHDQVIEHSRKNENDDARKILEGDAKHFFETSSDTLDKLILLNDEGASASAAASDLVFS